MPVWNGGIDGCASPEDWTINVQVEAPAGAQTLEKRGQWPVVVLGLLLMVLAACGRREEATPPAIETPVPLQSPAATGPEQAAPAVTPALPTAEAPSATPLPPAVDLAPAPAPVGTVVVYEASVTLPTYPVAGYQSVAHNESYNWPYLRFDGERFAAESPAPQEQTYRLLVLENAFLTVTIMPELGGRVWQAIHKATGANMFYQNPVVKPSSWGPVEQSGWLAVGGLAWGLPVGEHGYDWGVEWGYLPLQHSDDLASVTVFTPRDGRYLNASITISLRSGAASFEVESTISNLSEQALDFAYWETALLAPGSGNKPSGATQFILPGSQMAVHSSEDSRLPGAGQIIQWPVYNGVDYAWLQNWTQFAGFFEYPAAHGPFAGVYDHTAQAGVVRIYPAEVVQGSRLFALGWQDALGSDRFTDDGSAYVELQGGLAPSFDDVYHLPAGGAVTWREVWYPIHAIGGLTYADEVAALNVRPQAEGLAIGVYPTRPLDGVLVVLAAGREVGRRPLNISPEAPFDGVIVPNAELPGEGPLEIQFQDSAGRAFFTYTYSGSLP